MKKKKGKKMVQDESDPRSSALDDGGRLLPAADLDPSQREVVRTSVVAAQATKEDGKDAHTHTCTHGRTHARTNTHMDCN